MTFACPRSTCHSSTWPKYSLTIIPYNFWQWHALLNGTVPNNAWHEYSDIRQRKSICRIFEYWFHWAGCVKTEKNYFLSSVFQLDPPFRKRRKGFVLKSSILFKIFSASHSQVRTKQLGGIRFRLMFYFIMRFSSTRASGNAIPLVCFLIWHVQQTIVFTTTCWLGLNQMTRKIRTGQFSWTGLFICICVFGKRNEGVCRV